MIKISFMHKVTERAPTFWRIEFMCEGFYNDSREELNRFARENLSGEYLYIAENSLVTWTGGCRFHTRVYGDKAAMLVKLVYG